MLPTWAGKDGVSSQRSVQGRCTRNRICPRKSTRTRHQWRLGLAHATSAWWTSTSSGRSTKACTRYQRCWKND